MTVTRPAGVLVAIFLLVPGQSALGQAPEKLTLRGIYWPLLPPDLQEQIKPVLQQETAPAGFRYWWRLGLGGQVLPRKDGGAILLVVPPEPDNLVLLRVSADGKVTWRDNNPEGKRKAERHEDYKPRIAGDGQGNVLLVWLAALPNAEVEQGETEPPLVARLFNDRGKVLEQTVLLRGQSTDSFELWPWPEQGWLITYATGGPHAFDSHVMAQLIGADGQKRWGEQGLTLGESGNNGGACPVFAIQDSPGSFFLLWHDRQKSYRAQRVDARGQFLWRAPIVVGEGSQNYCPGRDEFRRIQLTETPEVTPASEAKPIQAWLYRGTGHYVGSLEALVQYRVIVSPDGKVERK
jgi:hypothetical protein